MVAAGSSSPTAEIPVPNIPLIHRPGESSAPATLPRPPLEVRKRLMVVDEEAKWADERLRAKIIRLLKRLRFA